MSFRPHGRRWCTPALALLVVLPLLADAPRAHAEEETRPAWLVGVWRAAVEGGQGAMTFEPGGRFIVGVEVTAEGAATMEGTWGFASGQLVLRYQGQVAGRYDVLRLPEAEGRLRAKFSPVGETAQVVVYTKDPEAGSPGHPDWLVGSWAADRPPLAMRLVLLHDGEAVYVRRDSADESVRSTTTWRLEGDQLLLTGAGVPSRFFVVREEDVEGAPRARFVRADQGQVAEYTAIHRRLPFPTVGSPYEGPLVGRWTRVDATPPTAFTFLPDGRFERRREVGEGAALTPGTFAVSRGSRGEVLRLTTAALDTWTFLVSWSPEGQLRLTPERGGAAVAYARAPGDPAAVLAAARRADAEAGERHLRTQELRATKRLAPPTATPAPRTGASQDDDPQPGQVEAGALVFVRGVGWLGTSEEVLLVDRASQVAMEAEAPGALARAQPRLAVPRERSTWFFGNGGRVERHAWRRAPGEPTDVAAPTRWGRYAIEGEMILVVFDDGEEVRLRLVEGGRFLHHGRAILEERAFVSGTTIDAPR